MTAKVARWSIVAVGGALVLLAIIAGAGSRTSTLRRLVIDTLSDRLESEVELGAFSVDTFPTVYIAGEGLIVRHRGRRDVPPLISIKSFSVQGGLFGLISRPRRFRNVTLRGLEINIPPGGINAPGPKTGGSNPAARRDDGVTAADSEKGGRSPFSIDHLHAEDAQLRIIPRRAGKDPKVFAIHRLVLDEVGLVARMPFRAELTNPIPKGFIETQGTFGPWQKDEPGQTPVEGGYAFHHADLSTIKGIGGTLESTGSFTGQLEKIAVKGETRTPDFSLDIANRPVPLTTTFDAVVDGTDGDTYLNDVNGRLLETPLTAKGAIIGTRGVKGRTITVHVKIVGGRIDDLLRLSVKSDRPLLVGGLALHTDLLLPPSDADVIERLRLSGEFKLSGARFTDKTTAAKITGMSQRARGRDPDAPAQDVASDWQGHFRLANATLALSNLMFGVPGAVVQLDGTYGLRSEAVAFDGTLRMQATVSEAAGGGFKSVLLKVVDPLFRKGKSGAVIPIKVRGTRQDPKFGLDIGRVFKPASAKATAVRRSRGEGGRN